MNESTGNPDSRMDELETRLAFQDDLIENLNEVIARQDRALAELERRVQALALKLSDLAESGGGGQSQSDHEVPPHY